MIQMFLMDIQEQSYMRRTGDIFQLMTGKLTHDQCLFIDLIQHIKHRYTNVAHQHTVMSGFL